MKLTVGDIVIICFVCVLICFIVFVIIDAKRMEKWLEERDKDYDKELGDYEKNTKEKLNDKKRQICSRKN